jgi:hypothetical protein
MTSPCAYIEAAERIAALKSSSSGHPTVTLVFEGTARRRIEPSLPLGSSNAAVYGEWLGYTPQELAEMKAEGVIS